MTATGRRTTLHHRLSFDHGSGVIMLPDDAEDWLDLVDEDVDSDEEPLGPRHPNVGEDVHDNGEGGVGGELEQSVASLVSTESTAATPVVGVGSPAGGVVVVSPTGKRTSRYGTYFHHPERRRERQSYSIPGAFPR
jgi:hypothetical protein